MKTLPIIGGGLAGLGLGIALRQLGVPVILFEAQRYPRHRLCGEFLHGRGLQILEQLGISAAQLPADAPAHQSVLWANQNGKLVTHELAKPVRGLSRYWLDETLAKRFEQLGGELCFERKQINELRLANKAFIVTTGRKRELQSPWFGIKQQFRGLDLQAGLEMHLGRSGYLGLCQVDGGWVNACGLFRKETNQAQKVQAKQRLQAILQANGLEQLAERIAAAQPRPQSLCAVASLKLGKQVQEQYASELSLGDSRLCTSPLSGNGQSLALESAWLAAPILASFARGQLSWQQTQQQVEASLRHKQQSRLPFALGLHHAVVFGPSRRLLETLARSKLLPLKQLSQLVSQ